MVQSLDTFFRDITLPLLMPTTLFLAVVVMISHLQEISLPYFDDGRWSGEFNTPIFTARF